MGTGTAGRAARSVVSHALNVYRHIPYHPGKWKIVDSVCRLAELDRYPERPRTVERSGFKVTLDPSGYIERTLYYLGEWEGVDVRLAVALCPRSGTVLDIGANIGWYTLHMARAVGSRGQVHSFEPVSQERCKLETNVRLNHFDWVTVHPLAVSDRSGTVAMTLMKDAGSTAIGTGGETVSCTRLDDMEFEHIDFIKVDIEGAELRFLQGARTTLRRLRPPMLIEVEPDNLKQFNTSEDELKDELRSIGYTLRPTGSRKGRNVLAQMG